MRFSGAMACLAVIAAMATLSACGDSNQPSSPSQELVYYESFASDSTRMVRVAADGSHRTVLWEGRFLGALYVAPDGAILFAADGWYLIPAAGGPAAPFTVPDAPALWADWSPDAQRVVFSGNNVLRNTYNLYTVARDGSDLRKITPDSLDIVAAPSWSHDGSRIAYARGYIYTIAPDGSDVRQVTDGPDGNIFTERVWWSPDDRQMMTATPTGLRRITVSSGAILNIGLGSTGEDPWSPDGSRILYRLRTEPDNDGTTWPAVGVANSAGTENVQVSANGIGSYEPAWLPGSN